MTFAEWIRNFIDTLFHSRYAVHLEAELLISRNDRDRLQAKIDRYEAILMPLQSTAGAAYVRSLAPKRELSSPLSAAPRNRSWQEVQADWARAQEEAEKEEVPS